MASVEERFDDADKVIRLMAAVNKREIPKDFNDRNIKIVSCQHVFIY